MLAKYRILKGSEEFDELLTLEAPPYMRFRMDSDRENLGWALRETAEALRDNFEGYTSEVRYTDRLLSFPALFARDGLLPEPNPTMRQPDVSLLYSAATGDPGNAGYFPMNAVRWLTPPRDLAVLVTASGGDRFAAELFHFGVDTRHLSAEAYLLAPGDYALTLSATGTSAPLATQAVSVQGCRTRLAFDLPPHRLCVLSITRR